MWTCEMPSCTYEHTSNPNTPRLCLYRDPERGRDRWEGRTPYQSYGSRTPAAAGMRSAKCSSRLPASSLHTRSLCLDPITEAALAWTPKVEEYCKVNIPKADPQHEQGCQLISIGAAVQLRWGLLESLIPLSPYPCKLFFSPFSPSLPFPSPSSPPVTCQRKDCRDKLTLGSFRARHWRFKVEDKKVKHSQ
ncbi:hypothetical protein LIA77_08982 [Sarocladium implicatum]|nr:hypothetical protein LIA77_08982 [Sarocladium implicatum]